MKQPSHVAYQQAEKRTKIILFDFNGVVADAHYLRDQLNAAIQYLQSTYPEKEAFKALEPYPETTPFHVSLSGTLKPAIKAAFPGDKDRQKTVWQDVKQTFQTVTHKNIDWIEPTYELLQALKQAGARTAITSNQPQSVIDQDMQTLLSAKEIQQPDVFDAVIGISDKMKRKPAADLMQKAVEALAPDVPRDKLDILLIGDNLSDFKTRESASKQFPNYKVTLINHKDMGDISELLSPEEKGVLKIQQALKKDHVPASRFSFGFHEQRNTLHDDVMAFANAREQDLPPMR